MRLALGAALAVAAAGLMVVLYVGASQRGKLSHCRNNLRQLGGLAAANWPADPAPTGRAFWQSVRVDTFQFQGGTRKGSWKPPYEGLPAIPRAVPQDPFLCPVLGRTVTRPDSAEHIDFLGPRGVGETPKAPRPEPLGADRPGNHRSGGHVLRLDGSVERVEPILELADGEAWAGALKVLKD